MKSPDAADRALEILRNRVDGLGVSEPVLEREGTDGIVIQLPGLTDIKARQGCDPFNGPVGISFSFQFA